MSDMPAFPVTSSGFNSMGMTLRDYFAAKVMQSLLSDPECGGLSRQEIAKQAYYMAETMLLAREG